MLTKKTLILNKIGNLYLLDAVYRILGYKKNRKILNITKEFESIDSIMDYDAFRKKLKKLPIDTTEIRYKYVSSESDLYGHFNALLSYSGLSNVQPTGIFLEHGVNFSESMFPQVVIDTNAVIICQSDYKRDMVLEKSEVKPVIAVGPYIHYASDYYTPKKFEEIKKKLGRVLLLYTSHTWEKSDIKRDFSAYSSILKKYEKDYDTIMICVYWHDIDDPLYSYLRKCEKVKLVSAGFRTDKNFISRTKALISLSDKVVVTDIGTYVGYAIYLNKEIEYVDCGDKLIDDSMSNDEMGEMVRNKNEVVKAILSKNKKAIQNIYNKYWGESEIKSKKEIKEIIYGTRYIIKSSLGFKKLFSKKIIDFIYGEKKGMNRYKKIIKKAIGIDNGKNVNIKQ